MTQRPASASTPNTRPASSAGPAQQKRTLVVLVVYGAGIATNLQARHAGADLADPARRGRAVSTVLVATTLGALVGPNLVTVAVGGMASGVVVATSSYATLALLGGLVAATVVPIIAATSLERTST